MTLEELYREVILDHYRNPAPRGALAGDHSTPRATTRRVVTSSRSISLVEDGIVTDVAIQGQGCSISQASGSMMADAIIGKSRSTRCAT